MKVKIALISLLLFALLINISFGSNTTISNSSLVSNSILATSTNVNYQQAINLFDVIAKPLQSIVLYVAIALFFILEIVGLLMLFNNQIKRSNETGIKVNITELLKYAIFAGLILFIPLVFNIFTFGFPLFLSLFGKTIFTLSSLIIDAVLIITSAFVFIGFFLFLKAYFEDIEKYLNDKSKEIKYRREVILFIGLVISPFIISFVFLAFTQLLFTVSTTATNSFANVSVNSSTIAISSAVYQASSNACSTSPALWQVAETIECSAESSFYYVAKFIYPFAIQSGEYSFTTLLASAKLASSSLTLDIYNLIFPFILIWIFGYIDYLSYDYFKNIDTEKEALAFNRLKSKIKQYIMFIFSPLLFIVFVLVFSAIAHLMAVMLFASNFSPIPAILTISSSQTVLNSLVFITGLIGVLFAGILLIIVALFSIIQIFAGPLFILATYLFGSEKPHISNFGKRIYYIIGLLFILPMVFVFFYSLWFGILPNIILTSIGNNAQVNVGTVYNYNITSSGNNVAIIKGAGISALAVSCNSNPSISSAISQITSSTSSANQEDALSALSYACGNFISGWTVGLLIVELISLAIIVIIILLMHFSPALFSGIPMLSNLSSATAGKSFTESIGSVSKEFVNSVTNKNGLIQKVVRGSYNYTKAPLISTTEGAILEGSVATAVAIGTSTTSGINKMIESTEKSNAKTKIKAVTNDYAFENLMSSLPEDKAKILKEEYKNNSSAFANMFNVDGTINKQASAGIFKNILGRNESNKDKFNKEMNDIFGDNDSKFNSKVDEQNGIISSVVNLGSENRKNISNDNIKEMFKTVSNSKTAFNEFGNINSKISEINGKYDFEVEKIKNNENLSSDEKNLSISKIENERKTEIANEMNNRAENLKMSFSKAKEMFSNSPSIFSSILGNSTPEEMISSFKNITDNFEKYKNIANISNIKIDDKNKMSGIFDSIMSSFDQEARNYGFRNSDDLISSSKDLASVKASEFLNKIKNSQNEEKDKFINEFNNYMKEIGMKEKSISNMESMFENPNISDNLIKGIQYSLFDNLHGTSKEISNSLENSLLEMTNPLMSKTIKLQKGISSAVDENIKAMIQNPINNTLKTQISAIKKLVNESWFQISSGTITNIVSRIANENSSLTNAISSNIENIKDYQKSLLDKNISEREKNELNEKIKELQTSINNKKLEILSNNKSVSLYNKIPAITGIIDSITEFNVETSDDVVKRYKFRSTFIENQANTVQNEMEKLKDSLKPLQTKLSQETNELTRAYLTEQINRQKEKYEKLNISKTELYLQKAGIDEFLKTADMQNIDADINKEMEDLKTKEMINEVIKTQAFENTKSNLNEVIKTYDEVAKKNSEIENMKNDILKGNIPSESEYKNISNESTKEIFSTIKKLNESNEVKISKLLDDRTKEPELEKIIFAYYDSKSNSNNLNNSIAQYNEKLKEVKSTKKKLLISNELYTAIKNKEYYDSTLDSLETKINNKLKSEIKDISNDKVKEIKDEMSNFSKEAKTQEEYKAKITEKMKVIMKPYIENSIKNDLLNSLNKNIDDVSKKYNSEMQNYKSEFLSEVKHSIKDIASIKINDAELEKERQEAYNEIKDMSCSTESEINDILNKLRNLSKTNNNSFAESLVSSFDEIDKRFSEEKDKNLKTIIASGIIIDNNEIENQTDLINKFKERVKEIEKKRIKPKMK